MGAFTQAPKHSTVLKVKRPSVVVSPYETFNLSYKAVVIACELRNLHEMLVQTLI